MEYRAKQEAGELQRRKDYVVAHPELAERIKDCIINEQMCTGMTIDDLKVSWPNYTWKTVYRTARGHENWHIGHYRSLGYGTYSTYFDARYSLDFIDGKLVDWLEFGED